MSSPAKRRKKNDFQSSPKTVRSLDYFFGKQTKDNGSKLQLTRGPFDSAVVTESQEAQSVDSGVLSLTDEGLARRLQEEWNNENASANNQGVTNPLLAAQSRNVCGDESTIAVEDEGNYQQLKKVEEHSINPGPTEPTKKATLSLQSAASAEDVISSTVPFDENPLTFDPSKYIPDLKRHWATEGGDTSYALLTRCFVLVNSTQSRIKIVDTLVNLLRTIIEGDPESLLPTVSSDKIPRSTEPIADDGPPRYGSLLIRYLHLTYLWSLVLEAQQYRRR